MEELTQEEIEYRRYLRRRIRRRKRRRKVMIARAVVACVFLLIVGGITGIIYHFVSGGKKTDIKENAVEHTAAPTATPLITYNVPDGYEEYYEQLVALQVDYAEIQDILMNLSQYPQDLLKLVINNQETVSFVAGYVLHQNDTEAGGEITDEEISGGIPAFKQWDERWGYLKYGSNILAISGCGPTCMSMVYSGLMHSKEMSPADMAEYCMEHNYYDSESGTSWTMMTTGAENLGLDAEKIVVSENSIKTELEQGHPVICSMEPGDFTSEGHFIVLAGITDKGKLIINDPNSNARSEKSWKFSKVLEQTKAAWAYSVAE